jgi:hypothetical protein
LSKGIISLNLKEVKDPEAMLLSPPSLVQEAAEVVDISVLVCFDGYIKKIINSLDQRTYNHRLQI